MKLGVCTSPDLCEAAAKAGFDYIECALNGIAQMPDAAFDALIEKLPQMPLPILKCNCFLPGELKVTGPEAEERKQKVYLEKAFSRAKALGVELVVFGSGGARQVPEGTSMDAAWRQMAAFLELCGVYATRFGIRIALEPLRQAECNLLNLVTEATLLAALANHPLIGVLGDSFHMASGHEGPETLAIAGEKMWHVHISHHAKDLSGRDYPRPGDDGAYAAYFNTLRKMGYSGDVSVECSTTDFETDAPLAVARLRPFLA